ncbi:MAG: hypothetical protein ACK52Q_07645 [Pseudanabaena sp.]
MLNTILRGHYKIISHLGGGGFGQTYLAEDIDLPTHPTCMVKQLKPVSNEPFILETAKRLFDQESGMLYSFEELLAQALILNRNKKPQEALLKVEEAIN